MRRMISDKKQKVLDYMVPEDNGVTIGGLTAVENLYIQGEIVDSEGDSALDIGTSDLSIAKNVNIGESENEKDLYVSGDAEVGGNLTLTGGVSVGTGGASVAGNLSVAGNITGNSIIENMSGYAFYPQTDTESLSYNYIYAGAVKNGNKLTFVIALNIKKLSAATETIEFALGSFGVPNDIYAKLYPTEVGGANYILDEKGIKAISQAGYKITKDALCYAEKLYNRVFMSSVIENVSQNDEFYVRYEVTFLLSDNLVSE